MVYDCPCCGDLHVIRWDEHAGIDGDYVTVCGVEGKICLGTCKEDYPQNARRVTNHEEVLP